MKDETILKALQKAVDEAAAKGVTVKVEIKEHGFFPTEGTDVTITATPPAKKDQA